ncbi:DNA repair protein RadA [Helicobacter monodelphidis]|uniref:DNA repair protein RadA n=1 Tax=Helicobacter sp. 15-1451 TaxID=2004995 RepID=UPI000DCB0937|nr:DNA repair protein RadA [Helicobacter sp. 15-1451]RAX58955.1 DNA repair protein RadA [Helicobacter sp. 15-1451]
MTKKVKTLFECQHCGATSHKWSGKCPQCNSWDSVVELNARDQKILQQSHHQLNRFPISIVDVKEEQIEYYSSLESELDIVLGGGIVSGGLYLVGGSPGVGKSTLLLKMAGGLAKIGKKILYVSGEESLGQIALRAERLGVSTSHLYLLDEINLEAILTHIKKGDFELLVIDSIQTLFSENISSAPGSVSQVREVTFALMRLAKEHNIATFIIGHITKEGSIAGPRILEHMVDVVLYFEGDPSRELRILRSFKNRFGNVSEVGIFEMGHSGLMSAKNAQRVFFESRIESPGSAITAILEGSRALILEVQSLVSECAFGMPKRSSTGFDANRLNMLLALLERKLEIPLNRYDVFVNIAGGIKINEPSADLAVIAAILSSFKNRPLNTKTIFLGEVSLIGDIREVHNLDIRLKEAISQGFERAILPKKPQAPLSIRCFEAAEVTRLIEWM